MIGRSFIAASIVCVFFANGSLAMGKSNKDVLACELRHSLKIMDACRDSYKQNLAFDIESHIPEITWEDTLKQLKKQLEKYGESDSGITKTDLWKVYGAAVYVSRLRFNDFIEHPIKIDFEQFPDFTIMKLAQCMITESAASVESNKALTLLRGNSFFCKSYFEALRDSGTLHVPMGRAAYQVKEGIKDKPGIFLEALSKELSLQYWEDPSFVKTLKSILSYIQYEFTLMRQNKKSSQNYPGLMSYMPESFALHQGSLLLMLYIVNPFLISFGFTFDEAQKLSCKKELAIDLSKRLELTKAYEMWINLISDIIKDR